MRLQSFGAAWPSWKSGLPMTEPREAPQALEIEQLLLGTILANNDAYYRTSETGLRPEHFVADPHRRAFAAIEAMLKDGKVANALTLSEFFVGEDIAGGPAKAYMRDLQGNGTTILNAVDYAQTIVDYHDQRQLLSVAASLEDAVYTRGRTEKPRVLIEETERQLYALTAGKGIGGEAVTIGEAARTSLDMAAAARDRGDGLSGLSTGLADLDRRMGGLQNSDLIILAARPAIGKTSLAVNIARHLADQGRPVAFFSLEMSGDQLATRVLSEMAGVPSADLRRGSVSDDSFDRVIAATRQLQTLPVYIDATGGLTIAQIAMRARRLKRTKGIQAVFVDYLQIMGASGKRGRVEEVTEMTVGLKALAKELDVPVVALSQLSRQVEGREDKRPRLADLRESGSIEQDADVVLFIYRDEYYLVQAKPKEGSAEMFDWQAQMEAARGKAELIIAKQRHGPTGTVDVQFDAATTHFSDARREAEDWQMEAMV